MIHECCIWVGEWCLSFVDIIFFFVCGGLLKGVYIWLVVRQPSFLLSFCMCGITIVGAVISIFVGSWNASLKHLFARFDFR